MGGLAALREQASAAGSAGCRRNAAGTGWWCRGRWRCLPTCQLANLSAFRLVGKLGSWRGAGGEGGVIAECSDCIVLSVRVGGFLVYPGVRRGRGGERRGAGAAGVRSGGEKTERRGCDELTTIRSGAPPRCTADACQLVGLLACWLVGNLETWRLGGARVVRASAAGAARGGWGVRSGGEYRVWWVQGAGASAGWDEV